MAITATWVAATPGDSVATTGSTATSASFSWAGSRPTYRIVYKLGASAPASPTDAGPFVAQADSALYSAKQNGRNQVMRASAPDFTAEPQPGTA